MGARGYQPELGTTQIAQDQVTQPTHKPATELGPLSCADACPISAPAITMRICQSRTRSMSYEPALAGGVVDIYRPARTTVRHAPMSMRFQMQIPFGPRTLWFMGSESRCTIMPRRNINHGSTLDP
jgi:hypothetical protein